MQKQRIMIVYGLILLTVAVGRSQETPGTASVPDSGQNAGRSIEDLNLIGSETATSPISESPIDLNSGFRRKLFSEGMALRGLAQASYAQNTLQAPLSKVP